MESIVKNQRYSNEQIKEIGAKAMTSVDIKDRQCKFKIYKACFIGRELCKWFLVNGYAKTAAEAERLGQDLMSQGIIVHVKREQPFKNEPFWYRFAVHEQERGSDIEGQNSWHSVLTEVNCKEVGDLGEALGEKTDFPQKSHDIPPMLFDSHNCDLFDQVRPIKWVDPNAENTYDMLVIGAGAGGLVTAAGSKGVGAKVAIIERKFMGGDCLNFGCVPSKAFIAAANVAHTIKTAGDFGISVKGEVVVDFAKVMERMRRIRAEISENDSVERFHKFLGVDTFLGNAKFIGKNQVEVNGQKLTFLKCTIATGGRPFVPKQIEGLDKGVPYYTSENIFNLTEQPKRLLVVGSGPIGCELGQAFQRLGTQVIMIEKGEKFLPREDADAAHLLQEEMKKDGVQFHFNANPTKFEVLEQPSAQKVFPQIQVTYQTSEGGNQQLMVDAILLAVGRRPNVDDMGLDVAGVQYSASEGVHVDNHLKTTNEDIYAVGDCCSKYQFTHNSDIHARYVVRNALFYAQNDKSKILLPWVTYTEPEIAHVGKYSKELEAEGIKFDTYFKFMDKLDRALCEGKYGTMKIHTREGTDEILGATLVGGSAGDMISQITTAMYNGIGLAKMGGCVYPYPTYAESFRHLADQFNRKKLAPAEKSLVPGLKEIKY